MLKVAAAERRARIARRHAVAPAHRVADPLEAARSVVALHGTDPTTVHLSVFARVEGMTIADLDRAVYAERSLVKHLAMRRTLFVFPREILGHAQAGASQRVAGQESRRLVGDVEKAGLHEDGERWLAEAGAEVLAALAGGREAAWPELRDEIPLLAGKIRQGEGRSWGADVPIGPRALTVLSASGRIVRASNDGAWSTSCPRWAAMSSWLGEELDPPTPDEGVTRLVERWLRAFGPGTEADLKWWLGSTLTAVRKALADLDAVEVELDSARTGYLLPDDLEPTEPVEPWAALLPSLDPTTMGWIERDFYLGPHREQLFDRNGNAGPTAWWEGRIVGGWRQNEDGEVALQPLEDVGAEGRVALEREAARLTAWFGGARVRPQYPSPLSKAPA